ncbi:hypothetical protein TRVA0_013S01442 [Trichomonascus vanleenenianus]|uniref:uncharacterized protein n=1 Tax=Trichomonascus vanleenenianus TaxID=2268995 RepID=UPI003ECB02D4
MKVTVISGGTATNSLVPYLSELSSDSIAYILPISDNGGSTSELIRVVGGPAIGDIRSRIVRLIPPEAEALRALFAHRLPNNYPEARTEWGTIVDGTHSIWDSIETHQKELIRAFFIEVNGELLKRARPGREFRYEKASIGNMFLTGSRIFCGSLESAVELMLRITRVPSSIQVIPALNTNFSHHISALLKDGTVITGQSQISHPTHTYRDVAGKMDISLGSTRVGSPMVSTPAWSTPTSGNITPLRDTEDAFLPFAHPDLTSSQLHFSKQANEPLPSPIDRIFYINPYGHEIHPRAGTRLINTVSSSEMVVYSIGSLYTSTVPIVLLKGFAEAVARCPVKVMILNGEIDRETSGMTAYDCIGAIVHACHYSYNEFGEEDVRSTRLPPFHRPPAPTMLHSPVDWSRYATHLIHLDPPGAIPVSASKLADHGITCIPVKHEPGNYTRYDLDALLAALKSISSANASHNDTKSR